MSQSEAIAWCDGLIASGFSDYSNDVKSLDTGGRWIVVIEFEGPAHLLRFEKWEPGSLDSIAGAWRGPAADSYQSSLDASQYQARVQSVRDSIARGWLYQANICRVMSADLPETDNANVLGLAALLAQQNPAPYATAISAPDLGLEIACASPEFYLAKDGQQISSGPIKGTATTEAGLTDKDRAENVMIADLVRNDLGRICEPGSVEVPSLLAIEHHPTVVHLVSQVAGTLYPKTSWSEIIEATFPPGSVSGAPKFSALQTINELETTNRGPYCGAIGWIDADQETAQLAVGIRTFWKTRSETQAALHFGTGAGITWGSDPVAEWEETVLKARHLTNVAAGQWA